MHHEDTLPSGDPLLLKPEESKPAHRVDEDVREIAHDASTEALAVLTRKGFQTPSEFEYAVVAGNRKVRQNAERYCAEALSSILYAHNGEIPHSVILCECSDGRNGGPEMFSQDPNIRFGKTWKPQAGLLMFPSLISALQEHGPSAAAVDDLLRDPAMRATLFTQAEALFGDDIRHQLQLAEAATIGGKQALLPGYSPPEGTTEEVMHLASVLQNRSGEALRGRAQGHPALVEKIRNLGRRFPVTIELQSHSDPHHPEHGCGAHGSDLGKTLAMSAMNALVLQAFIDEKYPRDAGDIRIALTHHFTGPDETVRDVQSPDIVKNLDPTLRSRIAQGNFRPRFLKEPETGVVRRGKKNPLQINQEHHDEYIIRVSEYHKASGLENTSVLEQSMLPVATLTEKIIEKLVSIAQSNRIARDPDQPLFLHLDAPADNPAIAAQYAVLEQNLRLSPKIQPLIAASKLHIIRTRTKPFSFENDDRLEMEFVQ